MSDTADHDCTDGHCEPGTPLPYGSMVNGKLVPYTDKRIFTEIHTWWEGDPLPAGHIAHCHAELWVPIGQTVSGIVPFDTHVVLHKNPGNLFRYETALFTGGHGTGDTDAKGLSVKGDPDGTVGVMVHTDVDTRGAHDGWHELRVKPRVKHSNGEIQLTSSGWPIRTVNGNPVGGRAKMGAIIGRGWYTGEGYQNPIFAGPTESVLPGKTVSGQWTVNLRLQAGSGGRPPTFSEALIDSNFHHNPEDGDGGGIVLKTWQGEYRGPLTIDTTKLSNGAHKLLLRVEARNGRERLVAIQYVPFTVAN